MHADFEWNFTQLLNNKIYASSPNFVEICLQIINLYKVNQENRNASELSWVHSEDSLAAKCTITWGRHAGIVWYFPAEDEDDWRVVSRHMSLCKWGGATRTHDQVAGKLWPSAVTLNISKPPSASHQQNLSLFRAYYRRMQLSNGSSLFRATHILPENATFERFVSFQSHPQTTGEYNVRTVRLFSQPPTYYRRMQRSNGLNRW